MANTMGIPYPSISRQVWPMGKPSGDRKEGEKRWSCGIIPNSLPVGHHGWCDPLRGRSQLLPGALLWISVIVPLSFPFTSPGFLYTAHVFGGFLHGAIFLVNGLFIKISCYPAGACHTPDWQWPCHKGRIRNTVTGERGVSICRHAPPPTSLSGSMLL